MRTNNLIILVVLFLVCLGAALIANLPPPARPLVAITLLGYTNDAAGTRLANFSISNQGTAPAYLYRPEKILRTEPSMSFDDLNPKIYWNTVLEGDTTINFTIPPPTNSVPWHLTMEAEPDFGFIHDLKHFLNRTGHRMPYDIHSDWITNTP